MNAVFLGIDIGTTSLKAAAFDERGSRLALYTAEYTPDTDPATGYIELDPEAYVTMCRQAIQDIEARCGRITALSVDTQGETLILADGEGNPLCPAVVWLDNRAVEEAETIRSAFGSRRVYEVTGQPEITAGWPAAKLLWFQRKRPDIWRQTRKIFLLEDYILFRLSGRFVTEPTIQSSTLYYDVVNRTWWQEMLDYLGIDRSMLPALHKTAEAIGSYHGIPVVTGALDQIAGTIGTGVTDSLHISEMTGTIMAICVMTDQMPPFREDSVIPCHIHALDGKYCLILWSSTAGMALKWFRNQFAEHCSFPELDRMAETVAPGCDGMTMIPHFCGSAMPRYNPDATASFSGITLSHTRAHFVRAILEAIAFTLKENLDHVGVDPNCEIRITGGGASSPLWAQIKADVTKRTLCTVSESETACLGSAILAATGIGAFPSIEEAASRFVSVKTTYHPGNVDYREAYARFVNTDTILNRKGKS